MGFLDFLKDKLGSVIDLGGITDSTDQARDFVAGSGEQLTEQASNLEDQVGQVTDQAANLEDHAIGTISDLFEQFKK